MRRLVGPVLQSSPASVVNLDNNKNINNIASTNDLYPNTPSTPTRSARSLRPALQPRDHNAMMRLPPKSPLQTSKNGNHSNSSNNNTMPHHHHHDKNNARPLMPSLSAAAQKAANRTPFTPRVAGTLPANNATPAPKPRSELRGMGGKEDIATPVSTFLNHNITPRSGSRKSRVDSTNTTPTGTPSTPVAHVAADTSRALDSPHGSALGIAGIETPRRPAVTFSPSLPEMGGAKTQTPADSKFFFASDAKTVQAQVPRPPLVGQSKNSTFLYANGDAIPAAPSSSNRSAVGSDIGEERPLSKFFHANGTPDLQASPSPQFPPPRPGSTVSTSSRMTSPRLANNSSGGPLSPVQRPISPTKLSQNAVPTLRTAPPLPTPTTPRPQALGRGQSNPGVVAARRMSIEGQMGTGHARSTSLGSAVSGPPVRKVSGESIDEIITPTSPANPLMVSIPVSTPEEITESDPGNGEAPAELHSPIKEGNSLERLNELAANARRERKVLDLEITNSSLAAINRTLEREMRKQTAELRRYRRLSRSGRLSIATTASMRTSSGTMSLLDGADGGQLSDMSEEEEEDDDDLDGESDYSSESMDEGTLSPGAMAESDLRHRKRDEKRLQLDLSKHQQLLIDSQKMNQSLKRCLGWTEELIAEGKKALAYSVRVSDVELGGRVLAPDELEDDNEGMSDIGAHFLKEARLAAAAKAAATRPETVLEEEQIGDESLTDLIEEAPAQLTG